MCKTARIETYENAKCKSYVFGDEIQVRYILKTKIIYLITQDFVLIMKEHRKVDNNSSKNESAKLGHQQSRKPDKQSGRSTPMIFTSTWPIFKFKGRTSDKKTLRNSRNGKLKKGQKSKSGDEDADVVDHDIEKTFACDEQEEGQITSSEFERNGPSGCPTENIISKDLRQEANEVSTVKYDVQDQVMRVCTHALNSCCLSTKGGYESDDRQSCEEYGTAIDTKKEASKHCKEENSLRTSLQENDCSIQCIALLSGSLDKLQADDQLLSRPNLEDTDDDSFKDINLGSQTNQNQLNLDEYDISLPDDNDDGAAQSEPATLDISSCQTMNQIEIQKNLSSPRNSCPPRIMSGDLRDHLQLLSDGKDICTSPGCPIDQTPSLCEDSPDNSCSVSSSCSISTMGVLVADDFKIVETDSTDQNFVEVSLFGSSPPKCNEEEESAYNQQGAKPKKKGIGSFLTRNLFPRLSGGKSKKLSAPDVSHREEWTPFGRMQVKDMPDKQQKGYTHPPTGSTSWKNRHASLGVASSTTALIFENRPGNLPAKNPDEEQRHRHMYDQMVKGAKKKEKELAKQLTKNHVQQTKLDQKVHNSLTAWNKDILPNFDSVRHQKKTKELWWNGVPPSVRGKVWIMAIGNDLNITHELFEIFKDRAKDTLKLFKEPDAEKVHKASREASMDLIKLDVSRTFPHLCIFQKGGPYHDMLHSILGAYACYRPDVGYVQGMSFIAAVFLLNLDPPDAFICFSNLMNKPCQIAFFRLDQTTMQAYFATFEEYFQDNLPQLFDYFEVLEVTPDLYIIDWMYTLYSKSLPLDVACRVWDVFFRDGEEFLFRTALGILQLYQNVLLGMDFIHIAQFLTKLPENIASGPLFKSIAAIDIHQKKFCQVLSAHLINQQQQQQHQSDI